MPSPVSRSLNDWQTFHAQLAMRLEPGLAVLDVGCGRGEVSPFPWRDYPGVDLTGADVDPSSATRPDLRRFVLIEQGRQWNLPSEGFHLALARYVLEHVADPDRFLAEVRRALRPGGEFLFLTPNRLHPAMWVSAVLPIGWKRRLLAASGWAEAEDVFPTCYRMNCPAQLEHLAARHGFEVVEQQTREFAPCGYLGFCAPGRAAAQTYRHVVQATGLENLFGAQILGRWRKLP